MKTSNQWFFRNFPFVLLAFVPGAPIIAADADTESRSSPFWFPSGYFSDWFARVDRAKAAQPQWPSPLATTVVLLKEALRYDISRQSLRDGHTLYNLGSDKGLEFIPAERLQLIVGLPAWLTEDTKPEKMGFADQTFLAKYRIASGNEEDGNYMISAMLGLAVPNGSSEYTTHHFVFTPALGLGKGWGRFDIQSNLRVSVPENEAGRTRLGTPIVFNNAAQYHLWGYLWPELEVNYTYWPNGRRSGMSQAFVTPGLALYKFHLYSRLEFVAVAGAQFAVTDHPIYHRNFILSLQFPF